MSRRQQVLLGMAVVGFIFPNVMVAAFFIDHGSVDFQAYFEAWFATVPSTQIAVDIGWAFIAFSLWAAWEGRRLGMRSWWMPVPASLGVGLCFALPLFLYLRDRGLGGELSASPGRHPRPLATAAR